MWRSVGAVLVGFLTSSLVVMVGVAAATALAGPRGEPTFGYLAANIVLSILAAVVGGAAAASVAKHRPLLHAGALAGLMVVASIGNVASPQPGQPAWYPLVIVALGTTGAIGGGLLVERRRADPTSGHRCAHGTAASLLLFLAVPNSQIQQTPALTTIGWMAGCWEIRREQRIVEEQWMTPRGTIMLGMSRTTEESDREGSDVVEYEQSMIVLDAGRLVFTARPKEQASTDFTASYVGRDSVVFENSEHDFPKRISYRAAHGGDSLIATISGSDDDGSEAIAFRYARVACPH